MAAIDTGFISRGSSVQVRPPLLSPEESNGNYHSDSEWWSRSQLWDYALEGPEYFHARHITGSVESPYSEEGALARGTLVHLWAEIGPDEWRRRVRAIPDSALGASGRRTQATTQWQQDTLAEMPNAIILKADELADIERQVAVLGSLRSYQRLKDSTHTRECSIRWVNETTGLKVKARPDAIADDCIWDIKTTRDRNPRKTWWRSVRDYGYAFQAAHYLDGCRAAGHDHDAFVFVVSSTVPPYAAFAATLPEALIRKANLQRLSVMSEIRARTAFDDWSFSQSDEIEELFVPKFLMEE